MQESIRNPEFAAKLALAFGELLDGIRPALQRVSMRMVGEGRQAALELRNTQTHEVQHWPLRKMRLVPDQARNDALVIAPGDGEAARLVVRDRDAALAIVQAVPKMPNLGRNARAWPAIIGLGMAAAACLAGILFVLIPHMANRGAAHIPVEAEIEFGQSAYTQFTSAMGARECVDPIGEAAVVRMTARVTQGVDLYVPLDVHVVDHPMINAFALPGGQVVLHSALIEAAHSPEEVAAVLAHEIGHVYHRHSTSAAMRDMATFGVVGLVFGDYLGTSIMGAVANMAISSSHSRDAELAADEFAHHQLEEAGLPPSALGDMFHRMQENGLGQDLGFMQHLSTHPEMADRIAHAEAASTGAVFGGPVLTEAEWQAMRNMCN